MSVSIVTDEFLVNTVTESLQTGPTITDLANGGFVVSWMDFNESEALLQKSPEEILVVNPK